MKRVAIVALGLLLLLSGSACGKKASGNASGPTSSASPAASESPTPAPSGSLAGLGALSADCQNVVAAIEGAGSGFASSLPSGGSVSDYAQQAANALTAVAKQAPSGAVRDAFTTLANVYKAFATALNGVNYDPKSGQPPPSAYLAAVRAFAQPDFAQAATTVSTWIGANCSGH